MSPRMISILPMPGSSNFHAAYGTRSWSDEVVEYWAKTKINAPILQHSISPGCSWSQSLDQPAAIGLASVTKAIVQAIRATLPEFNDVGFHAAPAPVRWQGDALVGETFGHLGHPRIEHAAPIEDLALTRRPGAQLTAHWTRMKIGLRFFARSFFCSPADANLTIQFDPVKRQRRVRFGLELLSFFALVVGKKDDPIMVEAFQ